MSQNETTTAEPANRAGFCPVRHGEGVRAVLGGDDFGVAPYGRGYADLRDRSNHDFSNIEFALNYLPVAHDGERHAMLRDRSSKYLQSRNEVLKGTRQRLSQDAAAVFAKGGRIDLLKDVVDPMIAVLVKDLSGVQTRSSPSLIFDAATSLRKRRLLNDELGYLIANLKAEFPEDDTDATGIRLVFAILANDASKGVMMATLGKIFSDNIGKKFSEIVWPAQPTETGILFIERVTKCPVQFDGVDLATGTTMRNEFEALSREGDTVSLFGVGRHLCLGRGFFWLFWRDLCAALGALDGRLTAVEIGPRSNRVFAIPDSAFVEVTN